MTDIDPEEWLDRHGDYLYRYAMFRVRRAELAEDLLQETLLSAIKGRETFSGNASVRTWLISILRRKIVDHFRKQTREATMMDVDSALDVTEQFFDSKGLWRVKPTKWNADPQQLLTDGEFWNAFNRCLSGLPSRTADTFCLRELEGLDSKDVCKVLKIEPSNLWTQLFRARMLLRKCLEENWFGSSVKTGTK